MRFFAKTDVWNANIPWTTLASRYENLLKEKKEVNSRVQSHAWAYQAALKKIEMRRKEKELQEEKEDAKRDGILENTSGSCDPTNLSN